MTRVFIDNRANTLDRSQLIQSGGEGMVFALGKHAVKIYHRPSPAHQSKLQDWLRSGINSHLPPNLMGPRQLVFDKHRQVIGFQMPLLPAASQPLKRISQPLFWKQHDVKTVDIVTLFQEIHVTLSQIHEQGVVVGDLNDTNLFFVAKGSVEPGSAVRTYWIDVDSYQFGRHPCPVAMEAFLDPNLHGAADLGSIAYLSPLNDWYAYFTLLIKSLLQVHPYGGVHHQYKTIQARAQAGIAILSSAITYPKMARPRESLSDDLLHHVHLVYEKGQRMPFPMQLLEQYAGSLTNCRNCGLSYPSQRAGCPACSHRRPVSSQTTVPAAWQKRLLLDVDGFISYVTVLNSGRIAAVVRQGSDFSLVKVGVGGVFNTLELSEGRANYRFGSFEQPGGTHYLVVNPADDPQLLIMDVSGSRPKYIAMLETANFRGEAVFATTPRHLYRIAGNWIVRGCVRDGYYVEEAIATAHRAQTQFWGSPAADVIAGYHRVFAEQHFFLIDSNKVSHTISLPPLAPGEAISETRLMFTKNTIAIFLLINHKGRFRVDSWVSSMQGKILYRFSQTAGASSNMGDPARCYPYTTEQTYPSPPFIQLPSGYGVDGDTACWPHPDGLLIQQANHLYLTTNGSGT